MGLRQPWLDGKSHRIKTIARLTEGNRVLDVGPVQPNQTQTARVNDWWLHDHLRRNFDTVIGIDKDKSSVEELQKTGLNIHAGDIEKIQLDESFDSVVLGELIEHLENPGMAIANVHNLLADNGALILSTPHPWAITHVIAGWRGSLSPNKDHTTWYGPNTIQQLLESHGFEVESLTYTKPHGTGVSQLLWKVGLQRVAATHIVVKARKA